MDNGWYPYASLLCSYCREQLKITAKIFMRDFNVDSLRNREPYNN